MGCGPCAHMGASRNRRHSPVVTRATVGCEALISSSWGIWATLACIGASALHIERSKWGKGFNAALLATVLGLVVSNLNIVPAHAPHIYGVVNSYLLPLAVPLLLFSGNLSRVLSTGRLLGSFLCATFSTVAGTMIASMLVPLTSLGADGHMVAAALTARHIGGSINYVAVTELLGVSAGARMAGLAADDVIVTLYFIALYTLAKRSGSGKENDKPSSVADGETRATDRIADPTISVIDGATAIGISALLCAAGSAIAQSIGYKGGSVAIITLLTVLFATFAPSSFLTPGMIASGESLGAILLQIFFASVGASGSLSVVVQTAPWLFAWSAVAVATHLLGVLVFEKLFGFPRRETCLSSNANIGGPTTAAGMAAAFNWTDMIVPSILIGILGYTIGTPIGVFMSPCIAKVFAWRMGLFSV
ncbi:membrane protein YjcL [Picochlorum sp. SENEW3]|nr:membrane protein YjcL [Picochlorum sp. SENEW3]